MAILKTIVHDIGVCVSMALVNGITRDDSFDLLIQILISVISIDHNTHAYTYVRV